MERRHSEGEGGVVDPALLGDDLVVAHAAVPVGVHETGEDGLAGDVHDGGVGRRRHVGPRPDRGDPVATDDDGAVGDHLVPVHGDQACADESHGGLRLVRLVGEADLETPLVRLRTLVLVALQGVEALFQVSGEELVAQDEVDL